MQNINNFLTEQLEVSTETLTLPYFAQSQRDTEFYTSINMLNPNEVGKIGNFLKDNFRLSSGSSNLTETTGFFLSKSLILSTFIIIFLSVERALLEINSASTLKDFKSALKSKTLSIGKREQVTYRKKKSKLKKFLAQD